MNKLLTPQEMADSLGVKLSTIYYWTHISYIPYVKLGKFVRFKEDAVNKWLDSISSTGRKTKRVDIDKFGI